MKQGRIGAAAIFALVAAAGAPFISLPHGSEARVLTNTSSAADKQQPNQPGKTTNQNDKRALPGGRRYSGTRRRFPNRLAPGAAQLKRAARRRKNVRARSPMNRKKRG